MPRPRKDADREATVQVSFRIPDSMAKAIDAVAEKKSEAAGGVPITRTQVVLLALREWLASRGQKLKK